MSDGDSKLGAAKKVMLPDEESIDRSPSSLRPSEFTRLKEREDPESGSLADIEPRAEVPSALFAMEVVEIVGASLTFVMENV
tara:strand:- start:309 stop:554 length:246 start_codon:yes stop_codon:yes gene_type:complete